MELKVNYLLLQCQAIFLRADQYSAPDFLSDKCCTLAVFFYVSSIFLKGLQQNCLFPFLVYFIGASLYRTFKYFRIALCNFFHQDL